MKKHFIAIKDLGYEKREKYLLYLSKNTFKQQIDLLIVERKDKKYYVLIKYFNTFMYVLRQGKNKFLSQLFTSF